MEVNLSDLSALVIGFLAGVAASSLGQLFPRPEKAILKEVLEKVKTKKSSWLPEKANGRKHQMILDMIQILIEKEKIERKNKKNE